MKSIYMDERIFHFWILIPHKKKFINRFWDFEGKTKNEKKRKLIKKWKAHQSSEKENMKQYKITYVTN